MTPQSKQTTATDSLLQCAVASRYLHFVELRAVRSGFALGYTGMEAVCPHSLMLCWSRKEAMSMVYALLPYSISNYITNNLGNRMLLEHYETIVKHISPAGSLSWTMDFQWTHLIPWTQPFHLKYDNESARFHHIQ